MDFHLYQVNQINQLLSSLNLQQLSKDTCNSKQSISTSSPRQEDTEMLEEQFGKIDISQPNPQYSRDIPLLRNPLNINDHYKICWQLRDKSPPQILMSERFPKLDGYLKEYACLMGEKDLGLGFIQIYPHILTLLSQRRYRQGQKILQIGGQWLIGDNLFSNTRIRRYLSTLHDLIQTRTQIFDMEKLGSLATTEQMKRLLILQTQQAIEQGLHDESVLYLFELKYVMQIQSAQPPINRIEHAQWLYFQLLPKSLNHIPFYYASTVDKYHEILSENIKKQHRQFTLKFNKLCNLLKGIYLKEQFNFQIFLKNFYPTDFGLYQKYMNTLTFQNYTWCLICQKNRIVTQYHNQQVYQRKLSQSDIDEQIVGKKAFLPIIDLLPHSQKYANVEWTYERGVITLSAKRQINCGDILYMKYIQLPIQSQYLFQGFLEVDSESYLDIFFKSSQVVIDIAQVVSPHKISRQKREIVKIFSEEINEAFILQFRPEQLRKYKGMKIVRSQAHNCMKRYILLAENICKMTYGVKCKDNSLRDTEKRKQAKLRTAQLKLQERIYQTIQESLECKRRNLYQIQKQICTLRSQGGKYACSEQYQLMCLYSINFIEAKEILNILRQKQ